MSQEKESNWLGVFAVALSATVFCTTEFLPVGVLRYIGEGLGVSEGTAGLMVTAPGVLAAVAAPVVTVAVKNHDRRLVLLGLSLLLVLSNLVSMLAPSFAALIVGRVLFGIGLGGFWAIGAGLGGRLVAERSVGRATSIIFAGVSLGMLIGGPAGAIIGDLVGWRAAFGAALAISVLAFLAQVISLPKLEVQQRVRPSDLLGIAQTQQGRIGLIAMFLVLTGQFATYTYVTPFLAQVSGFSGAAISSILLGYTAIGLLGNFVGGAGASHSIHKTFMVTIVFLMLPMLLLPVVGVSQAGVLLLLAIWGLSYGAMPVALQMWMAKAAPHVAEGGMALFVANFQISIAVGSFVGGLVVDGFGLFDAMYFGGVMSALSLVSILLFGRVHTHAQADATA
ncbi:MFS transporter [Rhizobium calliandrae]|nr:MULTISPECIES: MFS transporter [Rhizobium]MDL2406940.1 MFS transporter [Rhizobium calliandrae]